MSPTTSRRQFLSHTTALLAAAGASPLAKAGAAPASGGAEAMMPIIDTHQHLWDLSKFPLHWVKDLPKLSHDFLMADYLRAVEGLNVVKTIYMEVYVNPRQIPEEAEYVVEICRRGDTPMAAAVISGRPASEGFKEYVSRYRDHRFVKGVRQVLHNPETPPGYGLDERFLRGIRLLGELNLSFDIAMRSAELGDAAKMIDACPDTRFVLNHCGMAKVRDKDRTDWKRGIDEVARRKKVICKVSGIVASAAPDPWTPDDLAPIVNHVLDAFGPERVVFGSDWPVCTLAATYRQWVEALKAIVRDRKEEHQQKLFHDNAVAFYRLA